MNWVEKNKTALSLSVVLFLALTGAAWGGGVWLVNFRMEVTLLQQEVKQMRADRKDDSEQVQAGMQMILEGIDRIHKGEGPEN